MKLKLRRWQIEDCSDVAFYANPEASDYSGERTFTAGAQKLDTGSRRVLEKAGFALEGIMRDGVFKNGQVFDYCMYALLRSEKN